MEISPTHAHALCLLDSIFFNARSREHHRQPCANFHVQTKEVEQYYFLFRKNTGSPMPSYHFSRHTPLFALTVVALNKQTLIIWCHLQDQLAKAPSFSRSSTLGFASQSATGKSMTKLNQHRAQNATNATEKGRTTPRVTETGQPSLVNPH